MNFKNPFCFLGLSFFFVFSWNTSVNAQPGSQSVTGFIDVVFYTKHQQLIKFKTSDSVSFQSKDFKLQLFLLNEENEFFPLSVIGWGEPMTQIFPQKRKSLRFSYPVKNILNNVGFDKNIVKAVLTRKEKRMILFFDFTDDNDPVYVIHDLVIPFSSGTFKVIQSSNPKLIPVTE